MHPRWLTRSDLAVYLSISRRTVDSRVAAGKLPPPSYHLGRQLPRWDREAVDRAMSGGDAVSVDDLIEEIISGKGQERQAHAR